MNNEGKHPVLEGGGAGGGGREGEKERRREKGGELRYVGGDVTFKESIFSGVTPLFPHAVTTLPCMVAAALPANCW